MIAFFKDHSCQFPIFSAHLFPESGYNSLFSSLETSTNNTMKYLLTRNRFFRHLPTYPFIFLAVFPIMLLDLWTEMYHRLCFPLYGIPLVRRGEYIRIDRHRLKYLKGMQKYNCAYCGYANGVVKYWVKIFAETERYWCGIQHKSDEGFNAPEHHSDFIPYGDENAYREQYFDRRSHKF
jgi:hypothetical protein